MKILLTGGTGLLGKAFINELNHRDATYVSPTSTELNLLNFAAVDQFIATEKPDFIIHCAAYTSVDLAETERKECWDLNVNVLQNLLTYKLPIIHFSTDYVFNAPLSLPHSRESGNLQPFIIPPDYPRAPLNFYGQSKAAAEESLEEHNQDWWNIRTTWLYGPDGAGFPNKITQKVVNQDTVSVINDQYGRRTLTTDLAQFVLDNLGGLRTGHHHYQSPGPIHTWYDWAVELLGKEKVVPINPESLNLPAVRPKNSILI